MQTILKTTATVLPGNRVEIDAPGLVVGETVEVTLARPEQATETRTERLSVLDILATLPPGPRSAATWEAVERNFREERDSWDR